MSLNEKFGRGGSNLNGVNVSTTPDVHLLRRIFNDLSDATTAAQCEISWQAADIPYILTLTHSRLSARADWKLYCGENQSSPIWQHATNDINAVHRLIVDAQKQSIKPAKTLSGLKSIQPDDIVLQERRAININSNLSGKLRKLFIDAQDEVILGTQTLPVGRSRPLAKESKIPAKESKVLAEEQRSNKPATQFVDITPGREILQNLFMGKLGIFSYPTFLFFLEREYFHSIENKTPLSMILFKANSLDITDANVVAPSILQEIVKRIKATQRKTDVLAQYEEGKFVVLLPETSAAGAKSFVHRVEKSLSNISLSSGSNDESLKFTFGITTLGDHCSTLHTFLTCADKTLKQALTLGMDIFTDQDLIAEYGFHENEVKIIDLAAARELVSQLISVGIFSYPAFLAFLEQEYYRTVRKEQDLLVVTLKIRLYEETFDQDSNLLPDQAFHEVIRRIGRQLNKRDIFAHYGERNFIIMRPNATAEQMDAFSKKLIQGITNDKWLTPECPASALIMCTQTYIARAHPTAPNLFCLVQVN